MSTLLEQASLVMIPSGYKEDVVYSQIPTDGSGDLSFTRASNGTRINSAGLVEVCPWNLCEYSEDQTQWTSQNATTVTANSTTAPNGTLTADTVTPTAGNDDHYRGIGLSSQVGELTAFIYVKPNGYNFFDWGIWNGSQYIVRATFDLVNLTYTFTNAGTATIESVGNGWLKCGISGTNASLSSIQLYYRIRPTGGTGAFTGDGTSGAFIWGAQLNIGSIAKPYFPTTDLLNVPRLTYQNGGGGCPSLLLEKQSTNYALWSQVFTNVVWTTYYGTTTDNETISPDGTQNASKVIMGSGDQAVLRQSIGGLTNGSPYTFSLYIKQGSGVTAFLDVSDTTATVTITPTNEWVRYTYTANWSTTNNFIDIELRGTSGSAFCYIWGAQLEAGSYATSLINTTSSSATRVADACSKTGISSLIGQTQGTIFVDFVYSAKTGNNRFSISAGSSTNWIFIGTPEDGATNASRFYIKTNNIVHVDVGGSSYFTFGQRYKLALAYKSGDWAVYGNGTLLYSGTDAIAAVSSPLSVFNFFSATGGVCDAAELINQALLFKTRLTNAELASLTTI